MKAQMTAKILELKIPDKPKCPDSDSYVKQSTGSRSCHLSGLRGCLSGGTKKSRNKNRPEWEPIRTVGKHVLGTPRYKIAPQKTSGKWRHQRRTFSKLKLTFHHAILQSPWPVNKCIDDPRRCCILDSRCRRDGHVGC